MEKYKIETHPLQPFLPSNARVIMLGSFPPPQKRWSIDFFYPNFNNDMWRILALLFYKDKNYFVAQEGKLFRKDRIIDFLNEKGIAIYDTASSVRRLKGNASDQFLEIVQYTDIPQLLEKMPLCKNIVTTGQKATDIIRDRFGIPEIEIGNYATFNVEGRGECRLYRMPSSSRAYPLSLDKKVEVYRRMFFELNFVMP